MTQQFQLKSVVSSKDWDTFIDLPWRIYKDDPNWVPPLRIAVRDTLDVRKNPFFKHASMHPVMVMRGEECVGRVVAIVDDAHNEFHKELCGGFGFFECIEDQTVANMLLDEAMRWTRSKGMTLLRGPLNPSTNHECGLLVEGYGAPPSIMMTYNPAYYATQFENWGLKKTKDLFAYDIDARRVRFSERLVAHAEKLKKSGNVTFRPINMKKFDEEVRLVLEIYNDAWETNWGFVPMSNEEFWHMAKDMKAILDPNLLLIAEVRGEPAGFGLALPDVNQAFKKIPDGRLLPTGLLKLLWYTKGPRARKTVNRLRILTLGIKKKFRESGVGPLLYTEYLKRGIKLGYAVGEASWILEDNIPMNRALQHMCGERTKVYRIYERG